MQKNELARRIAEETGIAIYNCEKMVDALIDVAKECLFKGESLTLPNFATFEVNETKEHAGRNPATNKVEIFPRSKRLRCKFSQRFKAEIKGKRETDEEKD